MRKLLTILIIFAAAALLGGCGSSSSGGTTEARAQTIGGSETDVVASVASMTAGDIYYIDFNDSGAASIDFSGADPSAKYTMIVQSTEAASSSVTIAQSDISQSANARLDNILRLKEKKFADSYAAPAENAAQKSFSVAKATGDSRTFKVLSSITSTTSYTTVTAVEKCAKSHIILYLDNVVDTLESADIDTLCDQFESAAATDASVFGAPSDVNGDGHVVILITHAVNELGASGGGIITGYFYASDLYDNTSSNPTSNEMEIIYILAPDPDGEWGTEISKEFAMSNLMPAVVPHELQHAINYNQHVLVNGGSSEESWLNEALSHFAEDRTGFGMENPSRVEMFLLSPELTSLAPSGSPDLYERGAEYLFVRFLYEQAASGDAFAGDLENTYLTGTENVEAAFAGSDANFDEWSEFMRRWAIAMALTNTGISSTATYQYDDRTLNATTGNWEGVCLICDAEDGRDTVLTGPYAAELSSSSVSLYLYGTATAFYTISSPPSSLSLSGDSSAGLQGVLIRTE